MKLIADLFFQISKKIQESSASAFSPDSRLRPSQNQSDPTKDRSSDREQQTNNI